MNVGEFLFRIIHTTMDWQATADITSVTIARVDRKRHANVLLVLKQSSRSNPDFKSIPIHLECSILSTSKDSLADHGFGELPRSLDCAPRNYSHSNPGGPDE